MNKTCMLLVGPPGSGKSTWSNMYTDYGYEYINQDRQGKDGHMQLFKKAIAKGKDVVVDRMNFSKEQRAKYLELAKSSNYETRIVILHESYDTCLERCLKRKSHPTIKTEENARKALQTFFTKYERVGDDEADLVARLYPDHQGPKNEAIICDLDGTLCKIDHRLHFVQRPELEKKDWKGFFEGISGDSVNDWCAHLILNAKMPVVFCSGRPDNYRKPTVEWLQRQGLNIGPLFMRHRADRRPDNIVKEIILDFEILTRYKPFFMIDDRKQVADMWRKRGYVCLHCAEGDF